MGKRTFLVSLVTLLVSAAGTFIALSGIHHEGLRTILLIAFAALVMLAAGLEMVRFLNERPRVYRDSQRINRFMHGWITNEGRVAILSHDMSWVSTPIHVGWRQRLRRIVRSEAERTIRELLEHKAANNELIVCLPEKTALSDALEAAGAVVWTFAELGVVPESRFTVVRYGRSDAELAIGRSFGGKHQIETFQKGAHPAHAMAEDLLSFVEHFQKYRDSGPPRRAQ